jgi:hypothetical protein
MKNPFKKTIIDDEFRFGLISDGIESMIAKAKALNCFVRGTFNGVIVKVDGDSNVDLIFRDQQRAQKGYIPSYVGPRPKRFLSKKDSQSDAKIKSKNDLYWANQRAQYKAEQELKAQFLRLKTEGESMLRDEVKWQASIEAQKGKEYCLAVFRFAENWANLMQLEMKNGISISDCAEYTSNEADIEGITGFQYGCAISILANCWEHGEELRKWHNLSTQIGKEGEKANQTGGVLNPALLTISM